MGASRCEAMAGAERDQCLREERPSSSPR
jgi:hypothetical protein